MPEKISIFDTTLRDGEQAPGAGLNPKQKLEIALQLERLKVDAIEAGFPISSPGDFEAVELVAREVRTAEVVGLARCTKQDIDSAARALRPARHPRVHVFLATSAIHRRYKLRKAKEEIIRIASEMVRYARRKCDNVEFSPEDASRTEPDFLCRVVEEVIRAGARVVNIPDTVGYAVPSEFGGLIAELRNRVPNIDHAVLSVHCHNDLGLATANSIAAVEAGARQVECTINGLGERAGNASLEEVVMAIKTRRDLLDFRTTVVARQIYKTSRLVSSLTGMRIQQNKAIVGGNAFRHEAGIHQDGMLKERSTYEIMRAEDVGWRESSLVLGKHSGRHALKKRLEELGHKLTREELERAFERFKQLADKKKEVFDDDLEVIVEDEISAIPQTYKLDYIHTTSGSDTVPTATVRLALKDQVIQDAACGDGPVDAAYKTIDRMTKLRPELIDYSLRAVTGGKDALGEVSVRVRCGKHTVTGRGASTDIIEASAKAYVNAMNRILSRSKRAGAGGKRKK